MKKYGLPSVETVAVMPTKACLRAALDDGGDRALRLMKNAGLEIVNGKVTKISQNTEAKGRQ